MAHFDSGFFFLVGNISIIAWGRSFLLRYARSISGSTAVRSNQPHRIESRDQTDPHTGQSTVHIKDQRKSSTCMERQQRHSVEFRLSSGVLSRLPADITVRRSFPPTISASSPLLSVRCRKDRLLIQWRKAPDILR